MVAVIFGLKELLPFLSRRFDENPDGMVSFAVSHPFMGQCEITNHDLGARLPLPDNALALKAGNLCIPFARTSVSSYDPLAPTSRCAICKDGHISSAWKASSHDIGDRQVEECEEKKRSDVS